MLVAQLGLDHRVRAAARIFIIAQVDELVRASSSDDALGFRAKRAAAIQAQDLAARSRNLRTPGPIELPAGRRFRGAAQRRAFGTDEACDRRLRRSLQPLAHAARNARG